MFKQLQIINNQKGFCHLPFTKIIIVADGSVSMCCHQEHNIGNIFDGRDILDIYRSDLAKEIREKIIQGELHHHCSSRKTCPFMNGHPKHSYNFKVNEETPLHLEICLPDSHCNIGGETPSKDRPACVMCPRNFFLNKSVPVDKICEKVKHIIPEIKELTILGTAEPFWKNELFRVFEMLDFSKYKHQIKFFTNTNGTCHTEKVIDRFFEEVKSSEVTFSIDAASPETYKRIRRIDAYERILKNIKYHVEKRTERHVVRIMNNINILNVHEMTKMVECASDLEVDTLIMLPTYRMGGLNLSHILINEHNKDIFKVESEKAARRAKEVGLNLQYASSFIYEKRSEDTFIHEPMVH